MRSTRVHILLLTVIAISAVSVSYAMVDRKLLQRRNPCGPPTAVYVGDDDDSCQRCASRPGTVAWCCKSDDTAGPTQCKPAGARCCEGPEYKYMEREIDDGRVEFDEEDLDDVWCVPATCRANFQP